MNNLIRLDNSNKDWLEDPIFYDELHTCYIKIPLIRDLYSPFTFSLVSKNDHIKIKALYSSNTSYAYCTKTKKFIYNGYVPANLEFWLSIPSSMTIIHMVIAKKINTQLNKFKTYIANQNEFSNLVEYQKQIEMGEAKLVKLDYLMENL